MAEATVRRQTEPEDEAVVPFDNDENPNNNSIVRQLLYDYQHATTYEKWTLALKKLVQQALSTNALNVNVNVNDSTTTTTTERRYEHEEIALWLLRNVKVFESNNNNDTNTNTTSSESTSCALLDKCLDVCCGPLATLVACSQIFLDFAAASNNSNIRIKSSQHCAQLQTALRTVRRLLLSLPEQEDEKKSTSNYDSTKSSTFLLFGMHQQSQSTQQQHGGEIQTVVSAVDADVDMTVVVDQIVSIALTLPVQIANAMLEQKLVLPVWCIRSKYLVRLVHCTLAKRVGPVRATIEANDASRQQEQQAHHSLSSSLATNASYLHGLVKQIVHNGGSDEVAIAINQCYHHRNGGSNHHPDNNDNSIWSFRTTILETMHALSTPRDCATLLRSIVRHKLSKHGRQEGDHPKHQRHDDVACSLLGEYCRKEHFPYLQLVCLPILDESTSVREAFVQLSILSSSSCSSDDRVFCHCIAMLLAACSSDKDDDCDSSSSGDDDDEGKQQYHSATTLSSVVATTTEESSRVLVRHLIDVASCWSETVFVQHTDMTLQHHVTNFILSAFSLLAAQQQETTKKTAVATAPPALLLPLVDATLHGVAARLESSIHEIRRDGMRVGEALAASIKQPFKFEDNDADGEMEHPPVKGEEVIIQDVKNTQTKNAGKIAGRRSLQRRQVDPDADFISDEDSSVISGSSGDSGVRSDSGGGGGDGDDDDSVWDETDTLIPYNLDDDEEDLRETEIPLYLRECLDLLRTPDTNESASSRHETGLASISSLVRSNPADLPDLTVPLCKALVSMENQFDTPGFKANLSSGLLSLAVMQPMLAGECLIKQFFGGEYGLDIRLLILHILGEAAYEICGEKALEERREERSSKSNATMTGPRVAGKRRLVPELSTSDAVQLSVVDRALNSIESRTRRWGRSGRQLKSLTVVNNFGSVAPSWFYMLVSGFMKHKDDTMLWGGANGARLLANFLLALATIVECSGLVAGTEILARDLCELAWSFRTVEVPEVRISVLIALANSFAVLRDDALMGVVFGLNDLPEFLRVVALEDSNKTCRVIAQTISQNVAQVWESMIESRKLE